MNISVSHARQKMLQKVNAKLTNLLEDDSTWLTLHVVRRALKIIATFTTCLANCQWISFKLQIYNADHTLLYLNIAIALSDGRIWFDATV